MLASMALGFTSGVITHAMGSSFSTSADVDVIVVFVSYVLFICWYCARAGQQLPVKSTELISRRLPATLAYAAGLSAVLKLGSTSSVQAAVLEGLVRDLSKVPDRKGIKTASQVVDAATRKNLALDPEPLQKLAASRTTLDDLDHVSALLKAVLDARAVELGISPPLDSWIISPAVERAKELITIDKMTGETASFPPIATAASVPPEMVAFLAPIGSPEANPTKSGMALILIKGGDHRVIIPLDGEACRNVIFSRCILSYTGKPLHLQNAAFSDCTFRFTRNVDSQKLASAILSSPLVNLLID